MLIYTGFYCLLQEDIQIFLRPSSSFIFCRHFSRMKETIKALSVLEKENLYGLVHFPCAKIFDQKNYTTYHVEMTTFVKNCKEEQWFESA